MPSRDVASLVYGAADPEGRRIRLGLDAAERGDWAEVTAAYEKAVRMDPDTAFLMISSLTVRGSAPAQRGPSEKELGRMCDVLVAAGPDHPGGYTMRGSH